MKSTQSDQLKKAVPKFNLSKSEITQLVLTGALIIAAFLMGSLFTKVKYLEEGKQAQAQAVNQQPGQAVPPEATGPQKVSVDDDPVLGDENAPVTIIDFTDYECPFCKRYFDETYGQIKEEYIDTGKVKYVVRDLPLSFHQNAPKQAEAAECAREQGGDAAYFNYHDEIFKRTTSNGTGLALDQLSVIATELGLNGQALQACLDSDKYKAEVEKDVVDAGKAGATGTPTFFIGKSASDGVITGTKLVGAQPFVAFKTIIDQKLSE